LLRAEQLTQRTNQFNLNGVRRSAAELSHAGQDDATTGWVVHARDRLGDYGIAGLIVCRRAGETLVIETLLLSCRALGRRIEDHVLAHLHRMAMAYGACRLEFAYKPTDRNTPMQEFLKAIGIANPSSDSCSIGIALITPRVPLQLGEARSA
jgi:FkbH-like protein